mmetsp:Transcript_2961/g.5016  ORF Transcript_2961/g.5016 Transcript_2961/m.5016 type:complete len:420 (+) Transcript_2961:112-1371(+)
MLIAAHQKCCDWVNRGWARLCSGVVKFLRNQKNVDDGVIEMVRNVRPLQAACCFPQCVAATAIFFYCALLVCWVLSPHFVVIAPQLPAGETRLPHFVEPVIMTIAMNGVSASKLVKSAREQGEFGGDLYVLTNDGWDGGCVEDPELATYLSLEAPQAESGDSRSDAPRQAAKHWKQDLFQVLDELSPATEASQPANGGTSPHRTAPQITVKGRAPLKPPTQVQRILYLDADMDVNHALRPFFAAVARAREVSGEEAAAEGEARGEASAAAAAATFGSGSGVDVSGWDQGECSVYMFRERSFAKSAFNGGALLLDRDHSRELLGAWKATLKEHPEFPRDQLALSLTMVQDVINGRENGHRNLKICELPSPGGVTYGASVLSYLRGLRSTTFTHWAGWKGIRGGWFARKDVNRCANSSGAL